MPNSSRSTHLSASYKGRGRPRKKDYRKNKVLQTFLAVSFFGLLSAALITKFSIFLGNGIGEYIQPGEGVVYINGLVTPVPWEEFNAVFEVPQVQAAEITPTATPTATPTPMTVGANEIETYILEKFADRGDDALRMLKTCENSKLNQKATNKNRNGTTDYGVFQINSIHTKRYGDLIS